MTAAEKALSLAYAHCELLKTNINIAIHELKIGGKKTEDLQKRLEKLRSSAHGAFLEINSAIKSSKHSDEVRKEIEEILDQTWSQ